MSRTRRKMKHRDWNKYNYLNPQELYRHEGSEQCCKSRNRCTCKAWKSGLAGKRRMQDKQQQRKEEW